MTLQDIFKIAGLTISHNWLVIIVILSLVQISPIKINPWSWIGGWIGKILGVKRVEDKVDKLEYKVDRNDAITSRVRILRFGDELRQGTTQHSKESFDQVLGDITHYNQYCVSHPEFENDKTVLTAQVIKDTYQKLYTENKI